METTGGSAAGTTGATRPLPTGAAPREVVFGHYRLVRKLGQGGMGEVWLARDQTLERDVALKIMSRKLTADKTFVERFLREARAAAAVLHPNVTVIHDFSTFRDFHYFVMEYVEGETLEHRLAERGPLRPAEALDVARQVAEGLREAWKRNLVHRDIKPSNILLTRAGTVKVTDFGLAKALEDPSKLTQTDMVMGTPHYVSPEQARGEKTLDCRSDMYSLGVTLYQALSGALPFDAATPMGVMLRHVNDPPPPLSGVAPALPGFVARLVHRMLEKDPGARFASYDDLLQAIEGARRSLTGEPSSGLPVPVAVAPGATSLTPVTNRAAAVDPSGGATQLSPATGPRAKAQALPPPLPALVGPATTPAQKPAPPASIDLPVGAAVGVLFHPAATFDALAEAPPSWPSLGRAAGVMFVAGVLAAAPLSSLRHWPALTKFMAGALAWDLLLTVPAFVLMAAPDLPERWRRAATVVVLGWSAQCLLFLPPFTLLAVVYPLVVYRGLQRLMGCADRRVWQAMFLWLLVVGARIVLALVGMFAR